jgi:hypothetical protein
MLKRRLAILVATGALGAGAGVATALADHNPPTVPPATTATEQNGQNGQEGVDEQGAANDIAEAANDVQAEVDNEGPDDQSGDQQGPNDQNHDEGDHGQSGDEGGH